MSLNEVVISGTLNADGTLQLDQKPSLSPGRVIVTLHRQQAGKPHERGLAEVIDEIQRNQQSRGFQGRSQEEIEAGLREGEDEYEKRTQAIRLHTTSGPSAGTP